MRSIVINILISAVATLVLLDGGSVLAKTNKVSGILSATAIREADFPLPRLSSGYDSIRFKQGHYNKDEIDAQINMIASGVFDGQPAAVACVVWSTGGTGCWEVLGLYREVNHKPQCVSWFELEDRARVNSIRISGNRVILDWVRHGPVDSAPAPSIHEIKRIRASQFERLNMDN